MTSRFTCFWIFIFMLDKTGQCQDVQNYNISLTWMNATSKCGSEGLEHDALILSRLPQLNQKQFWIGIGVYKILTPWMDVLGCYQLTKQSDIQVSLESSTGLCLWKCNNTTYFSYKEHLQECMCLNHLKEDFDYSTKLSLDNCITYNKSDAVLVHKVFNGDYQRSGKDAEMCMTFMCHGRYTSLYETQCMNYNEHIQGLCEDRNASSINGYWGVPYPTQLKNCKNRKLLLIHYTACMHWTLWKSIWTNIFRENIEVEIPGGISDNRIPVRCLSANISETEIKDLQISQESCTTRLNWFVCKTSTYSSTTTRQSVTPTGTPMKVTSTTMKIGTYSSTTTRQSVIPTGTPMKVTSTTMKIGPVIGGITGAIALLAVLFVMILCKIRSCGLFKTTNIDKQGVELSTRFNQHSQNLAVAKNVTPISNESYGITSTNTNNTYAVVNKIKKTDSELQNSDETYSETSYGEYDRLNCVSKRGIDSNENLYDSNAGTRNENDPTYDSSNHGGRQIQLDKDVYDHADSISIDGYSTSVRSEIRNENDVYDKAV